MPSDNNNITGSVLIIDDDFDITNILRIQLRHQGHSVYTLNEPINFLNIIEEKEVDVVLLDIMMPEVSGFEVLKQIRTRFPYVQVVMITALKSANPAVNAMKLGAFDYITKPEAVDDYDHLKLVVRNAINIAFSAKELDLLRGKITSQYSFENIIGVSQSMRNIFDQVRKVADSNITVLIYGESGTGKELIARAIHYNSERKNGPFADLNCAAVPENLIESELFGHEKGAFTGAYTKKFGKFEQANGGTLFLDEIGDMPLMIQAKILRAIQERSFERVGGQQKIKVDVRIISATNKDLKSEVEVKNFRDDLYYRLNGFPLYLEPLRNRSDDIPLLIKHFITKFSAEMSKRVEEPSPEALIALKLYPWPGNIRELENVIQRAIVLVERNSSELKLENLPLEIQNLYYEKSRNKPKEILSNLKISSNKMLSFEEIEKRVIQEALMRAEGNVTLAAEQLKIGRATIYRKIDKYGIKIK